MYVAQNKVFLHADLINSNHKIHYNQRHTLV